MLIGQEGIDTLKHAHVLIAGVGGVGSFAAEALARAGVGTFTLLDNDVVDITNLNRQIQATQET
ncbi:MAG: ThiF family adenylyltransferase, partial [Peptococcaceae bacterium]|nr:ThiF family adenylyltransferase [Peptococcaceae bacterium]